MKAETVNDRLNLIFGLFFDGCFFFFLMMKQAGFLPFMTSAQAGALFVLILNTAAYSGEILYGALQTVPRGDSTQRDKSNRRRHR